ncbi:MAG: acetate--CoA ligase family protein [Clostridiales bacterium]|nr:acetate--CoA ligase family protein [Clostridiales bacterium]MCF8022034.1 acetate--CoA ligase family protein [Clostridiales bacterium]
MSDQKYLTETEVYKILEEKDIKVSEYSSCENKEQAKAEAAKLGYPLVMKIVSPDILHKTDAGCVVLNVASDNDLEKSWENIMQNAQNQGDNIEIRGILLQKMAEKGNEVIAGIKKDSQFGHVILCGLGGIFVEVLKDVALRLVPVDKTEAVKMIRELKGFKVLEGVRGSKESDIDELANVLVKLSEIVERYPHIEELDINPLFVYEKGKSVLAVDGLIKCS